ncbi:MAG TPA: NAD-dependent epimerase/dehydratase family protein [Mycobacteriales bacterium]|nr:NAD-dependent epimerase/dehydratase family protein [Mycobacteriales bacterium]
MKALVTGVAGFVGSHLADALLAEGHTVRGVDCFTPYYDPQGKWANVVGLLERPGFQLTQADLRTEALEPLVADADLVFHQAGQPGVRLSWSDGFAAYVEHNVLATQRLLEAVRGSRVRRFVFASSSSVYGNAVRYPTRESDLPRPYSPYGVTKLAAEQLCCLYAANWGIPTVSLRYFTVYGPRQRPDMGIHRFIEAALDGRPIPLYGDGEQVRDFTFVDDVVRANLAAARRDVQPGTVLNVAGGGSVTVNQLLALIETSVGVPIEVTHLPEQPGDVRITGGAVDKAARHLGWSPRVGVAEGVASQVAWHREHRSELGLVSTITLDGARIEASPGRASAR